MIRLRQIKISINNDTEDELIIKCAKKLGIYSKQIKDFHISKKSIDARKKEDIKYVYEVDVNVDNEEKYLKRNDNDIILTPYEKYKYEVTGNEKLNHRPIIVGSGPSGLFCAYFLAEAGYKPLIIERGEEIDKRVETVEKFWNEGILNKNSNIQFGEGGAGTFSDGKLGTMIHDKFNRQRKVYELFVENGAPKEILYENLPHIGTDVLRSVIKKIRNKIISMGGEFRYNSCLTNVNIENNHIVSIEINNEEIINTDVLVLAIGHSARDTYQMIYDKSITMSPKCFAVGIRIMHNQSMINESLYGNNDLPPASYKLTYQTKQGRGVYTFCMCPGGYVINSSSEENRLVINGMSNYKRDSGIANSAIIVSINPSDYGTNPLDGIKFQEKLEKLAYEKGNGKIPLQLYKDYKLKKISNSLGSVIPALKGNYNYSNIWDILPCYLNESIIDAIEYYGTKIKGYNIDDAVLCAVESRTSSPVRIERDEKFESSVKGIYPAGEGAGYAGGITSCAIDGIKIFEQIASMYNNNI